MSGASLGGREKSFEPVGATKMTKSKLAWIAMGAALTGSVAMAELPSVKFLSAPLVSPTDALTYYTAATTHSISVPGYTRAPEIKELANGLGRGQVTNAVFAQRAYEYVYNNIRIAHMFGMQKGPLGALVDQSGTAFDQASLLVELLREAGVTASYQLGTITLTPAQVSGWFGTSDATVLCRMFADGGIPGTVNGSSSATCAVSGTVTSATMLHVWVSALSNRYDPSFKVHTFKTGIDLSTATLCGSNLSCSGTLSSVRTQARDAALTSADTTTVTGSTNAIRNLSQSTLETRLTTWAMNLKARIDSQHPTASTDDIVGGQSINSAAMPAAGATLPYGTPTATATWTEVPDRYRTTLRIQYDDINFTAYADETAGRRLRLGFGVFIDKHNPNTDPTTGNTALDRATELRLEAQELAYSYRVTAGPGNDRLTLEVNHPYAANAGAYMDDLFEGGTPLAPVLLWVIPGDDLEGPQPIASFGAAIVQGWGQSSSSAAAHYSALQAKEAFQGGGLMGRTCIVNHEAYRAVGLMSQPNWRPSVVTGPDGDQTGDPDGCLQSHRFSRIAQWLSQTSRASDMLSSVNASTILHHHSIGSLVWNNALNVESSISAISNSNSVGDRRSTIYSYAAVMSRLEGGVAEQISGAWDGESSVSSLARTNEKAVRIARFANASGLNSSGYFPTSAGLHTALVKTHILDYLNAGFSVITPETMTMNFGFPRTRINTNYQTGSVTYVADTWQQYVHSGFLAIRPSSSDSTVPDRIAFLSEGYGGLFKGASSEITGEDPLQATMKTTKLQDGSIKNEKFFGADAGTGTVRLTPPADLVTGSGQFPMSLSFQRSYDSKNHSLPNASSVGMNIEQLTGTLITSTSRPAEYLGTLNYGPDGSRIGGGWDHNWHITAEINSDAAQGLGEDSPIDAVGAITAINTLRALTNATPAFNETMSSVFVAHWLGSLLNDNAIVVKRPPTSSVFIKLPNGSFNPPNDSSEVLVQSGARVPKGSTAAGTSTIVFDYRGLAFTLTDGGGSQMSFDIGQTDVTPGDTLGFKLFKPTAWTFPTGVRIDFAYAVGRQPYCLTRVSSNVGRSLTFLNESPSYVSIKSGTLNPAPFGQCYLKSVTDEGGRIVSFTRPNATNALGQGGNAAYFGGMFRMPELRVTTPDNATTRYIYTDNIDADLANPSSVTRLMRVITAVRSPTDTGGQPFLTFAYDPLGRVKTVTDAVSQATNYFSGSYGGETLRRGDTRNPLGANATAYLDGFGKTVQSIDALGRATSSTYDGRQRLSRVVHPELNETRYTYDLRSNRLSESVHPKPGSALPVMTTSTTYGEAATVPVGSCSNPRTCNQAATNTDALSRVTSYGYNGATGQLTSITRPAVAEGAPQENFCYTAYATPSTSVSLITGNVSKVGSTENRVTTYAWVGPKYVLQSSTSDPANSLTAACAATTKANPLALTTTLTFDTYGNVSTVDGPRTDVTDITSYYFDAMKRLTRVNAALNSVTRYTYDQDGLLRTTRRARIANPTDASPTNHAPTDLQPSHWQTETRNYRPNGSLLDVTDAEGNQTVYAYDAANRQRVVTDPDGRQEATVYDAVGQKSCVWRGGTGWTAASAPTSCTWNPSAYTGTGPVRYVSNTYTANGKEATAVDSNNNSTSYVYDKHDRLRYTFFPNPSTGAVCTAPTSENGSAAPTCSGTAPNISTYEENWYSSNGTATATICSASSKPCQKRTRSGQTIALTYDALDRVQTKTASGQGVVTTTYNLQDEVRSVGKPASGSFGAYSTSYTYDADGRRDSETDATNNRSVTYRFNAGGHRIRTTWPDGYYVTYDFDALGRVTYVKESGTTELAYYAYDILSRRDYLCLGGHSTACQSGGGTNKIGYTYEVDSDIDVVTQILNGTNVTLDYGRNRSHQVTTIVANDAFYLPRPSTATNVAYVPNALNQYNTVGGQGSTYDLNGNLLTWSPTGGTHTYTYDSENRLVTAAVGGSATSTIRYHYDGLGRRGAKIVSGTRTDYLLDGDEEIAEYSGSTILRRYVVGSSIDERIARIEGTGTGAVRTYYHVNHQGSVIAITDAAGSVVARLAYDAYGRLGAGASTTGEAFRYTGRRFDPETGLYYYRARYYTPELGRFLQVDPIGYKDDFNLYAYTGNDPANKTDPKGEFFWMAIGAAVSGGIQLAAEAVRAGGISKMDGKAWARVGISTAAGALGGGAGTLIGKHVATAGARVGFSMGAGGTINASATTATTLVNEGRMPTAGEAGAAFAAGAVTSGVGATGSELIRASGPRIMTVPQSASVANKSLAGHINQMTRSAHTERQLISADAGRTVGNTGATVVDGVFNEQKPPSPTPAPQSHCRNNGSGPDCTR